MREVSIAMNGASINWPNGTAWESLGTSNRSGGSGAGDTQCLCALEDMAQFSLPFLSDGRIDSPQSIAPFAAITPTGTDILWSQVVAVHADFWRPAVGCLLGLRCPA